MRNLFLIICLYIMVSPVWAAIDCNSIFPGPIQSYSNTGELYMQNNAKVENYNSLDVCFKSVKGYEWEMNPQACGAGKCEITKTPSLSRAQPTFLVSSDAKTYKVAPETVPEVVLGNTVGYGKSAGTGRWDLGSVTLNKGSMRVSDTYSTYVIKGMTLYENSTVTLKAGKLYIIDG
ncbi:TPA: hypothetical protein ACSP33_001653, partial [Aeromonas veronii]